MNPPPETVDFGIRLRELDWVENDNPFETAYEISNTKVIEGEYVGTKFTGELTVLKAWDDVSTARVHVVLKDSAGKAMGGDFTYVDVYEVGDVTPFEIYSRVTSEYETYEISGIPA